MISWVLEYVVCVVAVPPAYRLRLMLLLGAGSPGGDTVNTVTVCLWPGADVVDSKELDDGGRSSVPATRSTSLLCGCI